MRIRLTIIAILLLTATAQAKFLDGNGAHLYYEECGAGPAVVLLHDGLLHSVVWDDMWPALCGRYHVVRYDRRGYGRSAPATSRFAPEEDLFRLMRHCKIERAVLVGCSSGSAVAIDFALAHPQQTEALFLIGPVVHGMRSSDYFNQRGNAASAPLATGDTTAAAENWSKDPFQVSGDRAAARKKVFETLAANPQNFRVPGQFEIRPSPPAVTRLRDVQAPTLMIIGDADIADVHAFGGAIQAAVPVVRREVWKDDGHLVQLEKPAEVIARLEAFIALAERKTVVVADATLRKCGGSYALGNSPAKVALKNHRLVLQLSGDADVPLFAESEWQFFVRTTGTEVRFERDGHGKATAMIIHSPGADPIRCPRIS